MEVYEKLTLANMFAQSVKKFGSCEALTMVGEKSKTYIQADLEIKSVIAFLEKFEIKQGDKIAILSTNMPNWAISYFAITTMGAIVVPLLPDFSSYEIGTFLNHAGVKALFISDNLKYKLKEIDNSLAGQVINIEDYTIETASEIKFMKGVLPRAEYHIEEDDLASIIYTSGTTGFSKGVMLTHKNIVFNAIQSGKVQTINDKDRFLSVLPLSHSYENTIGLVLPLMCGACVYYLPKPPVPSVLLPALKEVKPTLMLTVPLIMEKIYRNKILAEINGKIITRLLHKIPYMRKKIYQVAGKKLMETFGGQIKFFGIGGAKLDRTVERFLIEAHFPYAIGYGLTETSPLIAGANPQQVRLQSTGPIIEDIEVKINNPDAMTGEGEIWVKGPNVMKGYYKEEKLTKEVFSEDGWLKTGDLGVFDKDQFLFIKGRLKNMIIGPNGENIYPEDIESVINNFKYVVESLVVQKKGKLVAMVHFNKEELEARYQHLKEEVTNFVDQKIDDLINELYDHINSRVNKYSRVHLVVVQPEPFQKTATQKIKRFIYY